MYFYYGISHSTLENPEEEIELKVDQNTYVSPPAQTVEQTAVWDRHGYENRMAEDGNSWNSGGGCWNAGNVNNQGWDDQSISLSNNNNKSSGNNGSYRSSTNSSKKPSSVTKSSAVKPKTKQPPVPPTKKPTTSRPDAAATTQSQSAPKKDGFGMFVEETQFPTWDD